MQTELLALLRAADGFVSGEELSRKLGITRSAVWKAMKQLKQNGYQIDSVTNRGYRLVNVPDLLTPEEIGSALQTEWMGKKVYFFEETDSTNEEAKRRALQGAAAGSAFVAEGQTAAKGRLGRSWQTPAGTDIAFSVLLRPEGTPADVTLITLVAGLAVCRALRAHTGCDAQIKWPNDVVIGRKKVCGILTELGAEAERISFVVIGAGINVNNSTFPPELREKATSLSLETGRAWRRAPLLAAVLGELEGCCRRFLSGGAGALLTEYKPLCLSLGRRISVERGGRTLLGTAVDVASDGGLVAENDAGERFVVQSGEVSVQGVYESTR